MKSGLMIWSVLAGVLVFSACGERGGETNPVAVEEVPAPVVADAETVVEEPALENACADEAGLSYLCGPVNAEDILWLGDSEWLLVSGLNGDISGGDVNGRIHAVNHVEKTWEIIFPGDDPLLEQDMTVFADCPGPLDVSNFSAHGLALKELEEPDQYRLYLTSHGAREAVEVFDVDASSTPEITWVGCVLVPDTGWINSVVILDDGGFLTTQFFDPGGAGVEAVFAGEISGHVFEWHPGGEVNVIPGTELSGANGIAISDDERWIYVAALGTHEVVRFDRSSIPIGKESVEISIVPDNVRWTNDGKLYTAGGNVTEDCPGIGADCSAGWSVFEIDPDSLEARRIGGADANAAIQAVSSALLINDKIWIGTYAGDRLGILSRP